MSSTLSADDVKALEQTRQRLLQLSTSLATIQRNIGNSDPLPSWTSIQQTVQILASNLDSISSHLSSHETVFSSLVAYPLPSYPGRTQEVPLNQLLRKKLEPSVEDWVAEGKQRSLDVGLGRGFGGREDDMKEMWSWAGPAANEVARQHDWDANFSLAVREMGIEKDEESEEESNEGEEEQRAGEDKMPELKAGGKADTGGAVGNGMPPMPVNDVLRFTMTGNRPGG